MEIACTFFTLQLVRSSFFNGVNLSLEILLFDPSPNEIPKNVKN